MIDSVRKEYIFIKGTVAYLIDPLFKQTKFNNCKINQITPLNFRPTNFSKRYMNDYLLSFTRIWYFWMTNACFTLLVSIVNAIDFINNNGGFHIFNMV